MSGADSAELEPQSFLAGLVDGVTRALPTSLSSGVLVVERTRSLGDRFAGRPGPITRLRLSGASETMTLQYAPGPRWTAATERVSGGVVISRRTLTLGEWLNAFAGQVGAIAADSAGDAAASTRALQALGVRTTGSGVRIDEANLEGDLRTIRSRVEGRVPEYAAATVGRIADLLLDTLPRVAGSGEPEVIVRRTATVYLPDTVRAYLALPADWTRDHVFPDGTTPAEALGAQLAVLESAAITMRDSAVQKDASALLVNGRFLSDRFAVSSLDLS